MTMIQESTIYDIRATDRAVIAALYNLLLAREPDSVGFAHYAGLVEKSPSRLGEIAKNMLGCKEREHRIRTEPLYKGIFPSIAITDFQASRYHITSAIMAQLKAEYLYAAGNPVEAVKLFKDADDYSCKIQAMRWVQIASKHNYLDSNWLLARLYNAWPDLPWSKDLLTAPALENYARTAQDGLIAEIFRILGNENILADALGSRLLQQKDSYTEEMLHAFFNVVLELIKMPPAAVGACHNTVAAIFSESTANYFPVKNGTLVFIGGFLSSGSGAVYDFLRDATGVADLSSADRYPWPVLNELSFFHSSNGLFNVFRALGNTVKTRNALVRFFIMEILHVFIPRGRGGFNHRFTFSILLPFCESEQAFLQLLDIFTNYIAGAKQTSPNSNEARELAATFVRELARSICNMDNAVYILMENMINCELIDRLEACPHGSIYIPVFRDARDMYISWYKALKCTPDDFISSYHRKLQTLKDFYQANADDYRFIPICYEDFVNSNNDRNRLLAKLNLPPITGQGHFNASVSSTRIGKYRSWHDQAAIEKVRSAFPESFIQEFMGIFR